MDCILNRHAGNAGKFRFRSTAVTRIIGTMVMVVCSWWLLTGITGAEGFTVLLGPRALGMGGAYTALADDPTALYWNTSVVVLNNKWDIAWFAGDGDQEKENFIDAFSLARSITPAEAASDPIREAQLVDYLDELRRYGTGIDEQTVRGFAVQHGKFGIMILQRDRYRVISAMDMENVTGAEPDDPSILDNESGLIFAGLDRTEFITSYSHFSEGSGMLVGINLKYIQAQTFYDNISLWDITPGLEGRELLDMTHRNREDHSAFSWDLSVSAITGGGRVSLAVHDVTGYRLERDEGEDFRVKAAYRLGYTTMLGTALRLAVDYDLTANRDHLSGEQERQLAWGMEKWFGGERGLAIRAGFYQRMGERRDDRYVVTAGLGFRLKWLTGDVAGMMDSDGGTGGLSFKLAVSFD
ncbi:conjugal transfer protein TraF [bacterium]|nr:conjugal transfer protein TraF [candidate division CSSED10-310 bacterium]